MLQRTPPLGPLPSAPTEPALDLGVLRRGWPLIVGTAAAFLVLALLYVLVAPPKFTANAAVMIDTRKNQLLSNQQIVGDPVLDTSGVESQVEVLKSESVALAVIRGLRLADDPDFLGGGPVRTALAWAKDLLGAEPPGDYERERDAVAALDRALKVKRVGASYVIELGVTTASGPRSAAVANALAEAYVAGELEARASAARRASGWLEGRIRDLREGASAAERRVQGFRTENGIIDTGRGLMGEQRLGDVNAQLVAARAATAEAKARLDRVGEVARGDVPDAAVADALRNEVVTRLRAQYLDLSARQAEWSARYGAEHEAAARLRDRMRELRAAIADEVRRIAGGARSEYAIARDREASIAASLAGLVDEAGATGRAQVVLRDLESSAGSARSLYDTFLQRSLEATQQQTFPTTDARLITAAAVPLVRSWPKPLLVLPAAGLFGALVGFAAALGRERLEGGLDGGLRRPAEVEALTGAACLGIVPRVERGTARGLAQHVLDAPFSRFAETLRGARAAIDAGGGSGGGRVVGIVSAVPDEGKTTVAANLAQLLARRGRPVLLIDADLRDPALTRALVPGARAGLIEVLEGARDLAGAVWTDAATGLHVLPTPVGALTPETAERLASPAMAALLEEARETYDTIVLDLPPIVPVADVRAMGHLVDGFVGVVAWGRTSREVVREALSSAEAVRERLIGTVLNKADPAALRRLEIYRGRSSRDYYEEGGRSAIRTPARSVTVCPEPIRPEPA